MSSPTLKTKLYVSAPHPNPVTRPRLTGQLDQGSRLGRRLTLLFTQVGSGKPTARAHLILIKRLNDALSAAQCRWPRRCIVENENSHT